MGAHFTRCALFRQRHVKLGCITILTALVSFLRFDEKASMHHNAAARFASMKRRLHIMISECSTGCDQKKVKADLEKICEK